MNSGTTHITGFNPNHLDEAAITQALARGQHSPVLQAFFGAVAFAELTDLAQQALATNAGKQAPLVYLLPGLLGSKLGSLTAKGAELIWLDPPALIAGNLQQLRIGKRRSIHSLGVILPGYLKLKLSLQAAGFRVKLYPYDWRRSVRELGKSLADELLHDTAGEIMLVAHSMGGLLARVALQYVGSSKVTRIVQLGTPNQGSFALVQALRGCYPTVRKLGAVDQIHSADMLAQQVFRSFYSFYEMLPAKQHTPALNLFDVAQWPRDALTPLAERLKLGRRLQRHLAAADRRCHIIAGIGQPTVSGVRRQDNEFIFQYSNCGDGTVPLALVSWSGAHHWYVRETHGQLPRNNLVCQATIELLLGETTSLLGRQYADAEHETSERSESELRAVLNGNVRWDKLPLNERRDLLEPVISPVFASLCAVHGQPVRPKV
jgi:pimeloyl-ACP methyl ester carboxylesterase